jgi:hypothetical protein
MRSGFNWFIIETILSLWWRRWWTFRFHYVRFKMFSANKYAKILLSDKLCQCWVRKQPFRDRSCLLHQGRCHLGPMTEKEISEILTFNLILSLMARDNFSALDWTPRGAFSNTYVTEVHNLCIMFYYYKTNGQEMVPGRSTTSRSALKTTLSYLIDTKDPLCCVHTFMATTRSFNTIWDQKILIVTLWNQANIWSYIEIFRKSTILTLSPFWATMYRTPFPTNRCLGTFFILVNPRILRHLSPDW